MRLFLSNYTNKVDRKGRVSLPASFRAVVAARDHSQVVVYKSPNLPCIVGSHPDFLEEFYDRIDSGHGLNSEVYTTLTTTVLGTARPLSFDPEGRVLLPDNLRQEAGIGDQATFVGLGKVFQIWEPEAFNAHLARQQSLAPQVEATLKPVGRGETP